ncbi:MAG: TIGR03564 family F420-dependent LLM class oxidoreductase [Actinomycetota bacterium]|nr:TIGR03564 family F420-dependent LLM class oxidoreductase [Actinomycetota bacterium]
MQIGCGIGTEAIGTPAPPEILADEASRAEELGFGSAWCVHFSRGIDSLSALVAAGLQTSRIELGVGVVPIYPRHPVALAQQAATVQALIGGRLVLGVGVSHRPVTEAMFGLPYTEPANYMREYLGVLRPMLREGKAAFEGDFFTVEAEFTIPGTTPVPVLVGGLSGNMVRVAGECADGVVTWLAGKKTLSERIVPGINSAAKAAGNGFPRIVAALPVALTDDAPAAREAANTVFARYGGLVNYQKQFDREAVTGPGDVAVVGTEQQIKAQLEDFEEIGVTDFWPVVFPVHGPGSVAKTRAALAAIGHDFK